jgi:hypothetical protein
VSGAVIYGWLKQERIDRGEAPGLSTEGQMELAAAKRRSRELETELAVSRKLNEVLLEQNLPQKSLPSDRFLTGQGLDVQRACLIFGVRCPATTTAGCVRSGIPHLRKFEYP